jgi:hypothetical protein
MTAARTQERSRNAGRLVLSCLLAAALSAGCGGGGDASPTPDGAAGAQATAAKAPPAGPNYATAYRLATAAFRDAGVSGR